MLPRIIRAIRRHATYANVAATISLACVAAATAHAAGVGSGGIADNSIQSRDIRNGTIRSIDVAAGGIQLTDIAPAARTALRGAKGAAGAKGADGANGAPGRDGATGPQGPQGPIGPGGASINSIDDLDGIACAAGERSGTIDVRLGTLVGDAVSITLSCVLAPLPLQDCGVEPAWNATVTCNTQTGQWMLGTCHPDWHDIDPGTPGCEYNNVTTSATEACDGLDNNSDGNVDEGVVADPVPGASSVCNGGWVYSCDVGFEDTDGDVTNGCEEAVATNP